MYRSVRGALRKERAYGEQHAVNLKQRFIRICPPRHVPFTQYKRERPHYPNKRTGWLPADAPGLCQIQTFSADEIVMAKGVVGYASSASSSAFASLRSDVSKPSVNQP
jgi:hypothetical protein